MTKFTFILDWNGGTYLSQVLSNTLESSIELWFSGLDMVKIGALKVCDQELVMDSDEEPVEIEGLSNVWGFTFFVEDKLAFVHIVKTVN